MTLQQLEQSHHMNDINDTNGIKCESDSAWQHFIPKDSGVILCAHGSRDRGAVSACEEFVSRVSERFDMPVSHGYLEFAQPIIHTSLDRLSQQGVKNIYALPMMLLAAGHVKNDIPSVLNTWSKKRDLPVHYGAPMGITPRILSIAGKRLRHALDSQQINPYECALVVIGRGTSDPDANGDVFKLARMLAEGIGFQWLDVGFSGVTFPSVPAVLDKVANLGFRHVVIYSHFLFQGVLIDRINTAFHNAQAKYTEINWVNAGFLGVDHETPQLIDDSLHALVDGTAVMNCALCKYRTQILGFDPDVGQAQESHHHHVEGVGTDVEKDHNTYHDNGHNNGQHGHDHQHSDGSNHNHHGHNHDGHHHSPYPHADHPLGYRATKDV